MYIVIDRSHADAVYPRQNAKINMDRRLDY
jgi:hypothetical protein